MNEQISNNQLTIKEFYNIVKDWISYFLSYWIVILIFGLVGGGLGLAYSLNQKPKYTATLTFALENQQQNGGLSSAIGLASQFGFDLGASGGGIFEGANLIELFKSRTVIEKTLLNPVSVNGKEMSFAEMYITNMKWRDKWAKNTALKNMQFQVNSNREQFTRAQDSILGAIYGSINKDDLRVGQLDKKIDIITISVVSQNEEFAKKFNEALVKEVSDFYVSTKSKKAVLNMAILERQTDSIRRELNGAITSVAAANDNTFALNPAMNIRRTTSSKRQVDVQANLAILTELVKQTELARVTLRRETPLIQVIDKPIMPLKKEKFGKLKGIILGGLLAGFFIIFFLTIKRLIKIIGSS